jgi:hypothetical protein
MEHGKAVRMPESAAVISLILVEGVLSSSAARGWTGPQYGSLLSFLPLELTSTAKSIA